MATELKFFSSCSPLPSSALFAISLAFDSQIDSTESDESKRNPYIFKEENFKTWDKNQHGEFKVLERFSKRSKLLQGFDNYRVAILEADPRTFILPSHWDAEEVFHIRGGRGVITLVTNEKRVSQDVERGDIMRIPSGTVVYGINTDDKEKLSIVMLLNPISIPGRFKEFFAVGGPDPETFLKSFSPKILEAALNTPREKLERLFGQQKQGSIVRASEEQIRALSKHSSSSEGWPFEPSSNKPINILKRKPSYSNDHGELHEVNENNYKQLRDLDVDVSLAKINRGSMMALNYNSKAVKLALVVDGEGEFEMACPHLPQQQKQTGESEEEEEEEEGVHYQTVRLKLSRGDLVVIPPGHPVMLVASGSKNLLVLCFGIRAENNQKFFLTGRNSIVNEMDREAKQLAFGTSAEEVEEVFGSQKDSIFLAGPQQRQREGEESMLSFAGF